MVGASSRAAEGEERKVWVPAQVPYPTSVSNLGARGSLQLAGTKWAEVQGGFCPIPPGGQSPCGRGQGGGPKNTPDFRSQGLINSLPEVNCPSFRPLPPLLDADGCRTSSGLSPGPCSPPPHPVPRGPRSRPLPPPGPGRAAPAARHLGAPWRSPRCAAPVPPPAPSGQESRGSGQPCESGVAEPKEGQLPAKKSR